MLPIVAVPLPQMLPFKLLPLNPVTDVTAFPTSYICYGTKEGISVNSRIRADWDLSTGGKVRKGFVPRSGTKAGRPTERERRSPSARRIWRSRRSHRDRASGRERVHSCKSPELRRFKPIQAYSSQKKIKKIILGMVLATRNHRGRNAPRLCAFA
jgi:hypothetical protein